MTLVDQEYEDMVYVLSEVEQDRNIVLADLFVLTPDIDCGPANIDIVNILQGSNPPS